MPPPTCNGVPEGGECSPADQCREASICHDGACGAAAAIPDPEPAAVGTCQVRVCDPVAGWQAVSAPNGGECRNDNACTSGDTCAEGRCVDGPPVDDPAPLDAGQCEVRVCEPDWGWLTTAAEDGSGCDDGDICTEDDRCAHGVCAGGSPLPDPAPGAAGSCEVRRCHPATGWRTLTADDGAVCDDHEPCTAGETCQDGRCTGGALAPDPSPDPGAPCLQRECAPGAGWTSAPAPDDTDCDDSDACTLGETCHDGVCEGGDPVADPAPDLVGPCEERVCDPALGWQTVAAPDGFACDDDDPLSADDRCLDGLCQGIRPAGDVVSLLPDTGQIACFDDAGEIPCGNPGSPWYGQDGDLEAQPATYVEDAPGVLLDSITGLLWQQDAPAATFDRRGAEAYCAALVLGEHEWRLPNRRELLSLVLWGVDSNRGRTISADFAGTQAGYYWTTDANPQNPDRTLRVSFRYGTSIDQDNSVADGYVRCVSGDAPLSTVELYSLTRGRGVFDPTTGLVWQRVPSGALPWQAALDYCRQLEALEQSGWRLPDLRELSSLLLPDRAQPILPPELFPGAKPGQVYWSSTTSNRPDRRSQAYIVGLGADGTINTGRKTDNYETLCVRSCPCPEPGCCVDCKPVDGGRACDDGDPETYDDECVLGRCVGYAEPQVRVAQPPFDCERLDCGRGGRCLRDADGGERCMCDDGWIAEGGTCALDPGWEPKPMPCRPVDVGTGTVCLSPVPLARPAEGAAAPMRAKGAALAQSKEAPILQGFGDGGQRSLPTPAGFRVHDQHATQLCLFESLTAGAELQMGSGYEPLSVAHLVDLSRPEGVPFCGELGVDGWFDPCDGYRPDVVVDRLQGSRRNILPMRLWEISYGNPCETTSTVCRGPQIGVAPVGAHIDAFERIADAPADGTGNPIGLDVRQIEAEIDSGFPVAVSVPVSSTTFEWGDWWNQLFGSGRVRHIKISEKYFDEASSSGSYCDDDATPDFGACACEGSWHPDASADPKSCVAGQHCCPQERECFRGVCPEGFHVVLLVGYDRSGNGSENFYFLNSWGTWGKRWDGFDGQGNGFPDGVGLMTHNFIASWAEIGYALRRIADCDPNVPARCDGPLAHNCNPSGTSWAGRASGMTCAAGNHCETSPEDGAHCTPDARCGDTNPDPGETCSSCPQDVRCTDDERCAGNRCEPLPCAHECGIRERRCAVGGLVRECVLGDEGCREWLTLPCPQGMTCMDDTCQAEVCSPHEYPACLPGSDDVWWFDSCDEPEDVAVACAPGQSCSEGRCDLDCEPRVGGRHCHDGDLWWFDGCGDPEVRAEVCGRDGDGPRRCSANGFSVEWESYERGCAADACYSRATHREELCQDGLCEGGRCVAGLHRCGDGRCAPGEEDCATCPRDCPCWSDDASYCSAAGRCQQCTEDGHCRWGSTCEQGSCVEGCHECAPVHSYRCGPDGERQLCSEIFNCRRWIDSSCDRDEVCCQGMCSPTTPPPPPSLEAPADNTDTAQRTVHFEWEYRGGANRVTLAICTDPSMYGDCIIREPPATWWYLELPLRPGRYWWSVRGMTPCDVSGWGEYAAPRILRVR